MQLDMLMALTADEAAEALRTGRITSFEKHLRDSLLSGLSWHRFDGAQIAALRVRLGITKESLAALLEVTPRTVTRWEAGAEVSGTANAALTVIDVLGEGIFTLMRGDVPNRTVQNEAPPIQAEPIQGKDITELRRRLSLTAKDLAALLGVSHSTVSKWENGVISPTGPAQIVLQILRRKGLEGIQ